MRIYGIDFTSRPTRRKPITCLACTLEDNHLRADALREWPSFTDFDNALGEPGPWIAGLDFPFGQARRFVDNAGWPRTWSGYVRHVQTMDRQMFRRTLDAYRAPRPSGDKEHRRGADVAAGSISPQKLYGTPVGLMFFEGASRLYNAGVTIPGLLPGDPDRIAVEAYPGIAARHCIGRRRYKQDAKAKQTPEQHQARIDLLKALTGSAGHQHYGLTIEAPADLADDPTGDRLDALLCATQAAWVWTQRHEQFGMPADPDRLEGWIADPALARTRDHR